MPDIERLKQLANELMEIVRTKSYKTSIGSEHIPRIAEICFALAHNPLELDHYEDLLDAPQNIVKSDGTRGTVDGRINYVINLMQKRKTESGEKAAKEEESKETAKEKIDVANEFIEKVTAIKDIVKEMQNENTPQGYSRPGA